MSSDDTQGAEGGPKLVEETQEPTATQTEDRPATPEEQLAVLTQLVTEQSGRLGMLERTVLMMRRALQDCVADIETNRHRLGVLVENWDGSDRDTLNMIALIDQEVEREAHLRAMPMFAFIENPMNGLLAVSAAIEEGDEDKPHRMHFLSMDGPYMVLRGKYAEGADPQECMDNARKMLGEVGVAIDEAMKQAQEDGE